MGNRNSTWLTGNLVLISSITYWSQMNPVVVNVYFSCQNRQSEPCSNVILSQKPDITTCDVLPSRVVQSDQTRLIIYCSSGGGTLPSGGGFGSGLGVRSCPGVSDLGERKGGRDKKIGRDSTLQRRHWQTQVTWNLSHFLQILCPWRGDDPGRGFVFLEAWTLRCSWLNDDWWSFTWITKYIVAQGHIHVFQVERIVYTFKKYCEFIIVRDLLSQNLLVCERKSLSGKTNPRQTRSVTDTPTSVFLMGVNLTLDSNFCCLNGCEPLYIMNFFQ
jgi:hypothetical protein